MVPEPTPPRPVNVPVMICEPAFGIDWFTVSWKPTPVNVPVPVDAVTNSPNVMPVGLFTGVTPCGVNVMLLVPIVQVVRPLQPAPPPVKKPLVEYETACALAFDAKPRTMAEARASF